MKYSTAIIPVFAVASLAASIETRQSKKLPWKEPIDPVLCGGYLTDEYICGTAFFCQEFLDRGIKACDNPQGWKSSQECLDAHEAKPSEEKCTKLRSDAVDECREKSKSQECETKGQDAFKECETKGQDVFNTCMGIQKRLSGAERIADWRARGCI